jgi:putative membrane protein
LGKRKSETRIEPLLVNKTSNMKKIIVILSGIFLVSCQDKATTDGSVVSRNTVSTNTALQTTDLDEGSRMFIFQSSSASILEIELGNLAKQNAKNPRVKAYGAMMAKDHSDLAGELRKLAALKKIDLPPLMSPEDQAERDKLAAKKGADFDRAYMRMMIAGHEKDIKRFRKATELPDEDVKQFAERILITLNRHLDSAKTINKGK